MLTLKNAQVLSGGVGGGQRFLLLATVGWGRTEFDLRVRRLFRVCMYECLRECVPVCAFVCVASAAAAATATTATDDNLQIKFEV